MERKVSDLYGSTSAAVSAIREAVSDALSVSMYATDSLYWNNCYLARGEGDEEIRVLENSDPLDGGPFEPDFATYQVLVWINGTTRSAIVRQRLEAAGLQHLKHEA